MTLPAEIKAMIVTDSDWSGTEVFKNRGIFDYERVIEFTQRPTEDQLTVIKTWLRYENCPGWTGILVSRVAGTEATYRFCTTMDSSD